MNPDITKDPEIGRLFEIAWEDAREELESHPGNNSIGFAPVIFARAREILMERHSIEWPLPEEDPLDRLYGNIRN